MAVVVEDHGALRLAAVNAAARAGGVGPGLTLADARALVPGLEVLAAEPAAEAAELAALADWCGRSSPWAAVDAAVQPSGAGLWLDISGCAHLFGGEAALLDDLGARIRGLGFAARAALADTPGAAWAVARFGTAESGPLVPPGRTRQVLAGLPLSGLRLAPEVAEALYRLGLRRIGDLYGLPRGPLAARFGESLVGRLDRALGQAAEPISPRLPVAPLRERLAFAEPIGRAEDIAAGLGLLLQPLMRRLERQQLGARRLELNLFHVDGKLSRAAVGSSRPSRDGAHFEHLFDERLEGLEAGFGIDVMILAAAATQPLAPAQLGLERGTAGRTGRDQDETAAELGPLVDRLGNRLGRRRVIRLAPCQSHLPERAWAARPALAPASAEEDEARSQGRARPLPPRPLRLFPRPQAISATAMVPDGPPVQFRWRRQVHRVLRAEGPERIAPEWWHEQAVIENAVLETPWDRATRDYFRVEDSQGGRFWLYREGLYGPQPDGPGWQPPRWYLHGVFG
ncbi:MAG: DNA polymerase Y family protein [Alphaproteobacteria bacterium]|nr:DNA polymerase Y family protein [Alphaproteobacteria bacterium]